MVNDVATCTQVDNPPEQLPPEDIVLGKSKAMKSVRALMGIAAATSAPVLITGETGTGKELTATLLHRRYAGPKDPFIKVNCPLLTGRGLEWDPLAGTTLLEGFGLDSRDSAGDTGPYHGTLFLNEIALLDLGMQWRLLERFQGRSLLQATLPANRTVQARVICSTSHRLSQDVEDGTFLRELFYLIKVVTLELPPLRQRRDDIPMLTKYFLDYYNRKFRTRTPPPPQHILSQMYEYDWPGNIRELSNLLLRYVVQGSDHAFAAELGGTKSAPPPRQAHSTGTTSLKQMARQAVQELERKIIPQVLEEHQGNRKRAARALNISYRAFLYKTKDAGVAPKRRMRAGWVSGPELVHQQGFSHEKREDTPV